MATFFLVYHLHIIVFVLSPLGGMATTRFFCDWNLTFYVLSPLGGMATASVSEDNLQAKGVLSPLGGMATEKIKTKLYYPDLGSKPTVWDGDLTGSSQ